MRGPLRRFGELATGCSFLTGVGCTGTQAGTPRIPKRPQICEESSCHAKVNARSESELWCDTSAHAVVFPIRDLSVRFPWECQLFARRLHLTSMSHPSQQIRFCRSSDGAKIAYASSGIGPTMIKAANWVTHLDFDWQSPIWEPWLDALSRNHTLIRYDARGCGLSDQTNSISHYKPH